jgi:hypothetical protein
VNEPVLNIFVSSFIFASLELQPEHRELAASTGSSKRIRDRLRPDREKPVVCGSGGDMTLQIACHHPQGIRAGMAFESAARTGSISFLSGYSDPHTFPGFSALTDNASTLRAR